MKKLLLLIVTIGHLTICKAQQFSFQMNFVDALGNTDSVTLGFDITASDTIDASFGEVNIISSAVVGGLDVRACNIWWKENSLSYANQSPFQTKIQIGKDNCGATYFPVLEIDIVTNHFPVTASWNHNLFQTPCLNGSFLTSVTPFGWWDTGGFKEVLASDDSISFLANQYTAAHGNDTASVYWVVFSDTITSGVNKLATNNNSINIFPNPAKNSFTIKSISSNETSLLEIINPIGEIVYSEKMFGNSEYKVDANFAKGIYFVRVNDDVRKLVIE